MMIVRLVLAVVIGYLGIGNLTAILYELFLDKGVPHEYKFYILLWPLVVFIDFLSNGVRYVVYGPYLLFKASRNEFVD